MMKKCAARNLLLSLLFIFTATAFGDGPYIARYHGDARAAFSYTFDDGRKKEAEDALSVINPLGIRGTFFVMPLAIDKIGASFLTWDDLKKMQAQGHEIGTHAQINPKLQDVDETTVDGIVNGGWTLIKDHTDNAPVSFAYPGGSTATPAVKAIVAEHHPFVRGKAEGYGSAGNRHWTPEAAQANVRKAMESGDWIVAVVHSIIGGYSPFKSIEEFRGHCEWLAAQGGALWIAPFGEVGRYVNERDAAKLENVTGGEGSCGFTLTCSAVPADLYNIPLTVVIPAQGVDAVSATANGENLSATADAGKILIDVPPGSGPVSVKWK